MLDKVTPEIHADMAKFRSVNQRLIDDPTNEAAYEAAAAFAQRVIREHSRYFSAYMAGLLENTLQSEPDHPRFKFNFSDRDDAQSAIEQVVDQSRDNDLSRSAALQILNIFAMDTSHPSTYVTIDDGVVATFLVATLADRFRTGQIENLPNRGAERDMARRTRTVASRLVWIAAPVLFGVGFLIAWLVFR